MWSTDDTNVLGFMWQTPTNPIPQEPGSDCQGWEIDFSQKVSNFSAVLLNRSVPLTYVVCDDQGGSQQITLGDNAAGTISLPDSGIRRVGIRFQSELHSYLVYLGIDNVQFTPMAPVFLDPVDSGFLSGPQVTTNTDQLSKGGVVVRVLQPTGLQRR